VSRIEHQSVDKRYRLELSYTKLAVLAEPPLARS
jgi:hypothetical protein